MRETKEATIVNDLAAHVLDRHDRDLKRVIDLLDESDDCYSLIMTIIASHVASFAATLAFHDTAVGEMSEDMQIAVAMSLILQALGTRPPRGVQQLSDVAAAVHSYPRVDLMRPRPH
jgi:dihydroorotase